MASTRRPKSRGRERLLGETRGEGSTAIRVPKERQHPRAIDRIESAHLRALPTAVIIGAQKAGTTSLHRYLSEHPDVGVPNAKEVHYFSIRSDNHMDWYRAHFPLQGEAPIVLESSPSYLFHPRAAERVHRALPQVKLIALLRNPVDRAYSQHQMNFRKGIEPLSFEEAIAAEPERLRQSEASSDEDWRTMSYIAYLKRGLYAEQLQHWLELFPREQLLILRSEAFFQRPEEGVQRTLDFLGLEPWHPDHYQIHNPGDYDDLQSDTRARLSKHFAPHNQRLYQLLGEDFGWDEEWGTT
jgi:hypothetical protein